MDYILWIDADAAFIDCTVSLSNFIENLVDSYYFEMTGIQSSGDIIFTGDFNGMVNNGVFLIKNSEWAMDFLDQWIFTRENSHYNDFFKNTNFGDQSIFQSIIFGFKPRELDVPALRKAFNISQQQDCTDWKCIARVMGNKQRVPKAITEHVMNIPQDMLNSYDYESGNRFVVHCAGLHDKELTQCKNLDSYIKTNSNC